MTEPFPADSITLNDMVCAKLTERGKDELRVYLSMEEASLRGALSRSRAEPGYADRLCKNLYESWKVDSNDCVHRQVHELRDAFRNSVGMGSEPPFLWMRKAPRMTDQQLSEIRARLDAYILADDPKACGDFVFSAGQDVAALLGYVDGLRTKLAAIAAVIAKES